MTIHVRYWSWFRELSGVTQETFTIPERSTVADLLQQIHSRHPKLESVRKSTLIAVGLEYQPLEFPLQDGNEVSLFPPVQGG